MEPDRNWSSNEQLISLKESVSKGGDRRHVAASLNDCTELDALS